MDGQFDRAAEDLGNIVALEHVNVTAPDQQLATLYYIAGLGLTRDPYLMTSVSNMWVNVGRSQFHLPTSQPQVLRGHVGIVLPDREALVRRLTRIAQEARGTRFDFHEHESFVDTICPWGNRIRCHFPESNNGAMRLGIAYVEFTVPDGHGRRDRAVLSPDHARPGDERGRSRRAATRKCRSGSGNSSSFAKPTARYPLTTAIMCRFMSPIFPDRIAALKEHGLISEESDQHQYRFKDITDPETGSALFTIEHEVRSMRHPLFMRPLVNRNPSQNNMNYMPGHDAWS